MLPILDPVKDDDEGALEIGFALPQDYNASSILFDNLEAGRGNKTAIITQNQSVSYLELCIKASQYGRALKALGLEKGDRVLLLMDDTPEYAAAFFGAMRAGFVPMLINTQSPPDLVNYYLEDSSAKTVICDEAFLTLVEDKSILHLSGSKEWLGESSAVLEPVETNKNDMAFWMYSSGSTGKPKGVVHLHHDLAYTVESYSKHILKLSEDDVCFSVPKIFFAYGLGNSLTFPFAAGAASILMAGRPEPASILRHIEKLKPSVFFGLPTLYTSLLSAKELANCDTASVRLFISAAEVLASEIFMGWKKQTGKEIIEGLGSTEVTHIYLSNRDNEKRLGSAGKRVQGYTLKLTDKDGVETGEGEEGILWIKGHSTAPLYWNRPDKTQETMRGEWLWTGDRFYKDTDGFYYFRGRADDLIKVSGQWVYPLEVELCLADHPDVQECAVLAHELADKRMTLRAFVALKDGKEQNIKALQGFVKSRLVPYKYPRIVEFLERLPKTGTGKIDRQALLKIKAK